MRDMDEALAIVNASAYGLLTAIFTRDLGRGLRFAESANAGWVNINEGTNYWESHLPFGGRAGTPERRRSRRRSLLDGALHRAQDRHPEPGLTSRAPHDAPTGTRGGRSDMAALPDRARVVVIGAGIVGNSMAYHLARLGWRDIVLIEKGTLPSPGGSTGHASNFIFLTDHSKEMTAFTVDSVRQYKELGVFTECGGIEVARTPERVEELKRRMAASKSWGIEGVRLITPGEVKAMVPFIDETDDPVGLLHARRRRRRFARGRHADAPGRAARWARWRSRRRPRSPASTSSRGASTGVRTDKGDIRADVVVVACGVWSPRIARMAGASIPLTPAIHQMIDIGPVPIFEHTTGEVTFPIVRDVDTNMYERQHGTGFEIGSYAHRAILMEADDIPSIEASALSPTQLPFTKEDFDPQLEDALELFPSIVGDEKVGVKLAINGLLSLTPDGNPILGETPEVKGLWSVAAIWIKEAPGMAKTDGRVDDPRDAGDRPPRLRHRALLPAPSRRARTSRRATIEGYNKTYGIVHPSEQWLSNRDVRLTPMNSRERELGAVFFEAAGWERPMWYESNAPLLETYARPPHAPRSGMGCALVVADHQRGAPRHARAGRARRPLGLRHLRRQRTGRPGLPAGPRGRADGRARRSGRLHALAQRGRRHRRRPRRSCGSAQSCSAS